MKSAGIELKVKDTSLENKPQKRAQQAISLGLQDNYLDLEDNLSNTNW